MFSITNSLEEKKFQKPLTEQIFLENGWIKSGWCNGRTSYIHQKFSAQEDNFYIELIHYIINYETKISEWHGDDEDILFRGLLKTNGDLLSIMKLLDYFEDGE